MLKGLSGNLGILGEMGLFGKNECKKGTLGENWGFLVK